MDAFDEISVDRDFGVDAFGGDDWAPLAPEVADGGSASEAPPEEGGEPRRSAPHAGWGRDQSDPRVFWVAGAVMLSLACLSLITMSLGARGGQLAAWSAGGAFGVIYLGAFYAGSRYMTNLRYPAPPDIGGDA